MSTEAAGATDRDPVTPERSALPWEQQKWREEYQLKSRELDIKEREQQRSNWSNPLVVAILAAAIAGLSSAVVAVINGRLQREIEQSKAFESLRIEESRSEAVRILEMIKTGEPDKAAGNLQFLIDTGLINNKERLAQIQQYLITRQPGTGPFLPAADGRYTFEQSEALTKQVAETLEKSLNDFIVYLERLGLKREADKVSIKIEKAGDATTANAYYMPDKKIIVINQLIAGDVDVPRREYSHHALMAGREKVSGANFLALESGLAWYLPSSFAGRPTVGEAAARAMKLDKPSIGDLSQSLNFKSLKPADDVNAGGMIWASLFWEVRTRLGQQLTDALVIQAWQKIPTSSAATADRSLAKTFTQELLLAAKNFSDDAQSAMSTILKHRGFPT